MEDSIEREIEKKFEEAILNDYKKSNSKRLAGFHVSALSYGCNRKIWYDITRESVESNDDMDGVYRMWIGTKLHETPITENHEFQMKSKRNGYILSGTIDEIVETSKGKFLIDKKFQQKLPTSMQEHHRNQVMFYAVLLKDVKHIDVDGVALVYFLPQMSDRKDKFGNVLPRMKVFVAQVTPEILEEYRKKLYGMVDDVSAKIKSDELPEKNISWYCKYCPHKQLCDVDGKR